MILQKVNGINTKINQSQLKIKINDSIIFNTTIKNANPIYNISDLYLNYLSEIINSKPDLLIIGTGKKLFIKMELHVNV